MSVLLQVVERMEARHVKRLVEYVRPSLMPGCCVALSERGVEIEVAIDTIERVIREEKIGDALVGAVVVAEQVGGVNGTA